MYLEIDNIDFVQNCLIQMIIESNLFNMIVNTKFTSFRFNLN